MHPALPQDTEPPRQPGQAPTTPGRRSPGGSGEGAAPHRPPGHAAPGADAGMTTATAGRCSPRVPLRQRGGSAQPCPSQPRPARPGPAGAKPQPGQPRPRRPHRPRAALRTHLGGTGPDTCPARPGQALPARRRCLARGAPGPARGARGRPRRGGSGGCREGRPDGAGGAPSACRGSLRLPALRGTPRPGADRAAGPAGAAGAAWRLRPPPSRRCSLPGF